MSIKKNERITQYKIDKEKRRYRKVASVYEKPDLTKLELAISNYHIALAKTMRYYTDKLILTGERRSGDTPLEKEYIEVLLWLYQFEWFELTWAKENFVYCKERRQVFGALFSNVMDSKFFAKKLAILLRHELVEKMEHKKYYYSEYEQRVGYIHVDEKSTEDRYRVSDAGMDIVHNFYSFLMEETPSTIYKKEKRLIWKTQSTNDFNDYSDF